MERTDWLQEGLNLFVTLLARAPRLPCWPGAHGPVRRALAVPAEGAGRGAGPVDPGASLPSPLSADSLRFPMRWSP
jgi:hypothetical protein